MKVIFLILIGFLITSCSILIGVLITSCTISMVNMVSDGTTSDLIDSEADGKLNISPDLNLNKVPGLENPM